jgi:hypothetical protein
MYPTIYNEIYDIVSAEIDEAINSLERKEALEIFRAVQNETDLSKIKIKSEAFYYARTFLREAFVNLRKNTLKE